MNNLATAYCNRICGDKADNIEQAIAAYEQALSVRTQAALPVEWAETMMNLANAYSVRIRGDKADNIEQAIVAYEQALSVRTQAALPIEWAETMINLASAYSIRIRRDRAENIEQAISAYEQVLSVMTQALLPVEWATTMNNLATAYSVRIRGDQAENIEQAIVAYKQALSVRTPAALPVEWATTMNNLANAYRNRIHGDKDDNIEQAISAYKQALSVRMPAALPVEWAQTMNNLALAYANRISGDKDGSIEQAISAYEQALDVRTKVAMPVEWAETMNNLALAYANRISGDKDDNIEQAIRAYRSSLEIFDPQSLPSQCRVTASALGNLHLKHQQWPEAAAAYQTALQAAEILYQSATLLDSQAAELAETADLPRRAAYALAKIGNLQQAALTIEQGRARGLSETLERDRADLSQLQQSNPDLYNQYRDLTNQLSNLETQQRLRQTSDDRHQLTPETFRQQAQHLRQTLTTTLTQIRQVPGYETFLTQPTFDDIRRALHPNTPLIYLIPTPNGSLALILHNLPSPTGRGAGGEGITPLWLDNLTDTNLEELLNAWFNAYGTWINALQTGKANPTAENLQALKQAEADWLNAIDQTTRQLIAPLIAPLITHLKTLSPHSPTPHATLIPTGPLSFLPLHAAWVEDPTTPTGKRYALDDIHFTYAPNARSLEAAQAIAHRTPADTLLAIDNPRNDLPNSRREVAAASRTFPNPQILSHQQATVAAVLNALPTCNILHLSCHGTANLTEPLTSGLLMHDGLLSLRDLLDLKLADTPTSGIRLAILSACETGLQGTELADEAISLPTGLLQAGVAGVIASLWSVSDRSTMLLLTRFYDLWRQQNLDPAIALRQAQQWLRDTPDGEIADYLGLVTLNRHDRTYAHPFHWAAFSYTGV